MEYKILAKKYFNLFSKKKEKQLFEMFDMQISLNDWENNAKGIKKVCKINKSIFSKFKKISVKPLFIYNENNVIIAELIIRLNSKKTLKVVDIIKFNKNNKKIISIKAYKI